MLTAKGKVLILFVVVMICGCTNYIKQGDVAYAKEDWRGAISNYQVALQKSSDPGEINYLKQQIAKSREELAKKHFSRGKNLAAANNYEEAYREVVRAYEYDQQPQIQSFMHELQQKLFDKYVEKGKLAIQQDELDSAIDDLTEALKYKSSTEIESLLADTKKVRKEQLFQLYKSKGEVAFNNGNYSDAVDYLAKAQEYGESNELNVLLEQATTKRNEEYFQTSMAKGKAALESENYQEAIEQFQQAQKYGNSEELNYLLEQANYQKNEKDFDKLVSDGEIALQSGNLIDAIEYLEKAKEYKNSDRVNYLLLEARQRKQQIYDDALLAIDSFIKNHNWEKAVATLNDIKEVFPEKYSDTLKEKHIFSQAMSIAEVYERDGDNAKARESYQIALSYNIESEYTQKRYNRLGSYNYTVTVHEAAILPWKPGSQLPWDGVSSQAINSIDAKKFMSTLTTLSGPQAIIAGEITNAVMKISNRVKGQPDCFIKIYFDDKTYGGETYKKKDELLPHWELSFNVKDSNPTDQRILSIQVVDSDLSNNDNVGSYQVQIGELLEEEGVHYIYGVEDGELRYGGILLLKISIERY